MEEAHIKRLTEPKLKAFLKMTILLGKFLMTTEQLLN